MSGKTRNKRATDIELRDRRREVMQLRSRGMSMRAIARKLSVSVATVKRDVDVAKVEGIRDIQELQKEEYVAETILQYDDVLRKMWELTDNPDPDVQIKAANTIRMILNDKRKALQDTGIIEKIKEMSEEQVNVTIAWSEDQIHLASQALILGNLTPTDPSLLPRPDTSDEEKYIEAQIVDEDKDPMVN